jgi:DNA-binding transcriptional LysR family regulator
LLTANRSSPEGDDSFVAQPRKYKDLQVPQLRSFCLAAAEGNFTTAAERLGLSVSAVWQQVRALERQVGVTLLRRRGRLVELTNEGRLLLELLQPHLHGLDSLGRMFDAQRKGLPQQVTVAATEYLLTYNLPPSVEQFTAAYPAVRLNLRSDLPSVVMRWVEEGEADLGIMPYDRDEPRSSMLEYQDLFEREFMLLTSASHPLARKKRVQPADLLDYPMILPPHGSHSQRTLERLLQRHDLAGRVQVLMESRTIGVVCHYAALGLGISMLYVGPEICRFVPNLRQRVIDSSLPTLPVAMVMRKGVHVTEPLASFRRTISELLADGRKSV